MLSANAEIDEVNVRTVRQIREIAVVLAIAATLAQPDAAYAQSGRPADAATFRHVDKAFGFALRLPADWSYDRTGFFGAGDSLGVLRGSSPDGNETLQILIFRQPNLAKFAAWIDYFTQQLSAIEGTQAVRVKADERAGRPGAYVVADAELGLDRTRAHYYCVQLDPDTIWVLADARRLGKKVLGGADEQPSRTNTDVRIAPEFARLIASLEILYDADSAEQMALALRRGKRYLDRFGIQESIRNLRTDDGLRYYKIEVAGKPIGFMTRQITSEREPLQARGAPGQGKMGLRVRERTWRFHDGGAFEHGRVDLFSSLDASTDLYEFWHTVLPQESVTGVAPAITRDQCIREGGTLFSTSVSSTDAALPDPRRPLKLEPHYLGLAWSRILPALLGGDPQEMLAFTVYDPETRTLIALGVRPLGERPLPGRGEQACAYELREGVLKDVSTVYADGFGNLLRVESGDMVVTHVTGREIDQQFGPAQRAAEQRLDQLVR